MTQSYDVIVIGSGIGGLTAALASARAGASVLMLEAGQQLGGYLNPFRRGKFQFDPGLHYLGEAGPDQRFRRLLDKLGLQSLVFQELDPEGFDQYVFPDYQIRLGRGLDRFHAQLAQDFPAERAGLARFFRLLARVNNTLRTIMRIKGPLTLWKALPYLPTWLRWGNATLAEILAAHFRDPNLKAALAAPCGDIGVPPARVHGLIHLNLLLHYGTGGYFPKGGTAAMRDAFVDQLRLCGAEMRRNARVLAIETQAGRVSGVRIEGERFTAPVVISNAQAEQTYSMVDEHLLPGSLKTRLANLEQSPGSCCLFLGVTAQCDTSPVADRNIWHYDSNDIDALYRPIDQGCLPDGSAFFLSVPSHKDPGGHHAPPGHQAVELVTLARCAPFERWMETSSMKRGDAYRDLKRALSERLIAAAEPYLPGLSGAIVCQEVSTPLTNAHFVGTDEGNIYGPAQTPRQSGNGRFSMRSPIGGLYLCGASVISAGILPCAATGYWAASAALAQLAKRHSFQVGAPRQPQLES